ncbi:MAG TPA: endo-1,4-beta-xylanase [Candidatus Saccharimonadales bacterium]|nr:endo-1,4-beta-xylanase [Candidatus Saccharimonadales bacterium]
MDLIQDRYVHMAGSNLQPDGLHINPVPFAIVNQDGSGGQPNPPVNLYGAHLITHGDFELRASLDKVAAKASLAFYGEVPIIYDEFRYERNTVQLVFDGDKLLVQRWTNNSQVPKTDSFTISRVSKYDVIFTKEVDELHIRVNDKLVATLPESNIFASGNVWFGAKADNKPWLLKSLRAVKHNKDALEIANSSQQTLTNNDNQGLQNLVDASGRKDFTIGAAVALAPLVSDQDYAGVVLGGNFGSITTENALKWQFVHPTPEIYDFTEADALVALAQEHDLQVHGHPLVFGEANPRWVQDLATATSADKQHVESVMTDHITSLTKHYAGKISSWDVVNEPIADYDEFEAGQKIRDSVWSRAMGEGYIAKAFTAARKADPKAKLFINEFGLEEDGERWDYFFQLVKKLKAQGIPIDGVGFQSHIYESRDRINAATLREHIDQLADIGLVSRISENDVYSDDGLQQQAIQYAVVLKACFQAPSCVSYTTWGVSDRYDMFRDDDNSLQYGEDFLWDKNMQPTPAVAAMRKIFTSQ